MKRYLFVAGVASCALLVVIAISLKSPIDSRAISKQSPIVIENQTTSLKIVSAQIEQADPGNIHVKVKNIGDKPVLCYHIQYGEELAQGIAKSNPDFTPVLEKGETSKIDFLIPAENARTQEGVLRLNLSLCMFEDLSAEGDWNLAQRQREQFEGMAVAFNAGQAEMDTLSNAPQLNPAAFNTALTNVSQLNIPTGLTEMQKAGFKFGVQRMQTIIRSATKEAAQGPRGAELGWQTFKNRATGVRSFGNRMSSRMESEKRRGTQ